jgi:hypothetical protein
VTIPGELTLEVAEKPKTRPGRKVMTKYSGCSGKSVASTTGNGEKLELKLGKATKIDHVIIQ